MSYTVEWPDAEYHEILPNLFMGGHLWKEGFGNRDGRHSTVSSDMSWDYVVSSYISDAEESWPRCDTRLLIFNDTESGLNEDTWERIRSAVDEVVSRWQKGQKVLVRCQAGFNRSGLVMSLVLMRLGFTAEGAINAVRKLRGKDVLINSVFESYVREREGEYRYPANLAETEAIVGDWMYLL